MKINARNKTKYSGKEFQTRLENYKRKIIKHNLILVG